MSGRGGRDRIRRDYPPRSEEKSHRGSRSSALPSRHLWVGNLAHSLSERMLADHFLQFGELESVSFQPGRSYAFVNFKYDEAAFAAIDALQGVSVAGNPLRIEFAKPEKALIQPRDEDYSHRRDEHHSSVRRSPFTERDSRVRHSSPDRFYNDNSKMDVKNAEPSEVLWVGFPASLSVDEVILRNAFSRYGEIEKISVFPGRTFAFVRFRNVMSASKAKENLHGKLFGNPRVHICFAKSEFGSSQSGRNSMNAPPSPRGRPYGRQGSSEVFQQDRYVGNLPGNSMNAPPSPRGRPYGRQGSSEVFQQDRYVGNSPGDPSRRSSPRFPLNVGPRDPDAMNFDRKRTLWADEDGTFEQRRLQGHGPELEVPRNMYSSPTRNSRSRFQDFPPSPSQQFPPRHGPFYDDSWDLPEETLDFHEAKKQKTSPFRPEAELPEYPFSDNQQLKHVPPRVPDFPQRRPIDEKFDSGHFNYNKQIRDPAMNIKQPYGERNDPQNCSYDSFQGGPVLLPPPNPVDWKRSIPEARQPPVAELWEWEGTIAKGGTAVCRARCFPVGKALDMPLPEILDCTARTGLDILAKHYYQAASAWVVFFVPESDADMGFYNEFMNYLGEKQRAAVAKLDDKNTLFLVPPSDFSEKILKVPGKLSISGVILRLEPPLPPPPPPPPTGLGTLPPPPERADTNFTSFHGEAPLTASPSGPYPTNPNHGNQRTNSSLLGNFPTTTTPRPSVGPSQSNRSTTGFINEDRQVHYPQNFNSSDRIMSSTAPSRAVNPTVQSYNPAMPKVIQEPSTNTNSYYTPGIPGPPLGQSGSYPHHEVKSTMPMAGLQPDQLAQLASTLLGQPRQQGDGGGSMGDDFRQVNVAEGSYKPSPNYPPQNNQYSAEFPSSQYDQMQQFQQQMSNIPATPQREGQPGSQESGQMQQFQQQMSNIPAPPQRESQPGGQGSDHVQQFQQLMSNIHAAAQREGQAGGQGSGQVQQFQQLVSNMPAALQREGQPGGQGSQSGGGGAQEEGDADPQRRLQATLQLAAALLQQIQQGKGT